MTNKKELSNIEYFGEPIYTYTLKQGIEDGFLAPYKVIRVGLNTDLEGWRPEAGKEGRNGWGIYHLLPMKSSFMKKGSRHESIGVHY